MTTMSVLRREIPVARRPIACAVKMAMLTLGATALAGTALAQDTEEKKNRYSLQLEEVVVTAQKREENFMSVPITVNAFTAQDMTNTGAANIQDIDDFMPGVEIGDGGATQVGITVRGVSSPNISTGGDPSVATFYDGSYMPRAATSIPFTDIARTEVLMGPQGTLFGRNATAGVVNIVPNKPHDEFEGFVKTRIGNHNLLRLEGMINAPITDNIAVRGNIFSHQRDGLIENVVSGNGDLRDEEFMAARGAIMFNLSDDTQLQLSADYEDRDEQPGQSIGVSKYAYGDWQDPFSSKAANDAFGMEETREMYGVAAQIDHNINDEWSVFGIVSYRDWDTTNIQDEEGTAAVRRYFDTNNIEESDIWYSEIRFNYADDRINLITGANYSQEEVYQRTDIGLLTDSYMQFLSSELLPVAQDNGLLDPDIELDDDSHMWNDEIWGNEPDSWYLFLSDLATSLQGLETAVLPPSFAGRFYTETMDNTGDFVNWGVFADLTYQLTDTIRLAGGLRYSYDEKEYSWQTFNNDFEDWPFGLFRVAYIPSETGADPENYYDKFSSKDDWSKVTGRFVADWEFSDTAMTYLSVATGYKSGGFDGQVFSGWTAGSFDPEEMTSIELGLKGDFFDNRLRTEVALFHHELDGRQSSTSTRDGPCSEDQPSSDPTAQPTVISSDEEADGIELIVTWTPIDSLRLTAMTTYRETESVTESYCNSAGEPAGGDKQQGETDNDYTLRADWTPDVPYGYLLLHVDYVFNEDTGKYDEDEAIFVDGPWYFQDRKMLSARIAWTNEDDNIEVALWGKNLLDEEYAANPGGFVADALSAPKTSLEDTITYGLDLRYSF